jgi:predicted HAD superfamily Cof-like phosphohydrolase
MSAREQILHGLSFGPCTPSAANSLLDAYRADVLVEAEVEIRLATERNQTAYPDMQAMVIRRQGMQAAEQVVRAMREETERGES